MKVHEFTIIASGLHPDADDLANLFFEAGCDDATISFQKGVVIVEFYREGHSFSSAVMSALENVLATGAEIERFEPDYLVSLADIARRVGVTRSAVSHYWNGERGVGFPTPVARITSESPLWDWCEVATWMHERDPEKVCMEEVVRSRVVKEANLVIETRIPRDAFMGRMVEKLPQLEAA